MSIFSSKAVFQLSSSPQNGSLGRGEVFRYTARAVSRLLLILLAASQQGGLESYSAGGVRLGAGSEGSRSEGLIATTPPWSSPVVQSPDGDHEAVRTRVCSCFAACWRGAGAQEEGRCNGAVLVEEQEQRHGGKNGDEEVQMIRANEMNRDGQHQHQQHQVCEIEFEGRRVRDFEGDVDVSTLEGLEEARQSPESMFEFLKGRRFREQPFFPIIDHLRDVEPWLIYAVCDLCDEEISRFGGLSPATTRATSVKIEKEEVKMEESCEQGEGAGDRGGLGIRVAAEDDEKVGPPQQALGVADLVDEQSSPARKRRRIFLEQHDVGRAAEDEKKNEYDEGSPLAPGEILSYEDRGGADILTKDEAGAGGRDSDSLPDSLPDFDKEMIEPKVEQELPDFDSGPAMLAPKEEDQEEAPGPTGTHSAAVEDESGDGSGEIIMEHRQHAEREAQLLSSGNHRRCAAGAEDEEGTRSAVPVLPLLLSHEPVQSATLGCMDAAGKMEPFITKATESLSQGPPPQEPPTCPPPATEVLGTTSSTPGGSSASSCTSERREMIAQERGRSTFSTTKNKKPPKIALDCAPRASFSLEQANGSCGVGGGRRKGCPSSPHFSPMSDADAGAGGVYSAVESRPVVRKPADPAARMRKMAMKKSIVAKGRGAKARVFKGLKVKTVGGLKKTDIIKNKAGKFVSKKASLRAKSSKGGKAILKWSAATKAARKQLGIKGFVAVKKGSKLYAAVKAIYAKK